MYVVHKEVFLMKKVIRAELRTEDWVNTGFILIEDIVESEKKEKKISGLFTNDIIFFHPQGNFFQIDIYFCQEDNFGYKVKTFYLYESFLEENSTYTLVVPKDIRLSITFDLNDSTNNLDYNKLAEEIQARRKRYPILG